MASKQELEALVKDQEMKIKDLEDRLSQLPPSDMEAIALRARVDLLEGTNRTLVEEVSKLRSLHAETVDLVLERDAKIADLVQICDLVVASAKKTEEKAVAIQEGGEVMTAKEIARATGLRNVPEDARFRRI